MIKKLEYNLDHCAQNTISKKSIVIRDIKTLLTFIKIEGADGMSKIK